MSVAVVTAEAGAGWPVAAVKVPPALALAPVPDDDVFFFLPFFAVCSVVSGGPCVCEKSCADSPHARPRRA